jgi:hypothetical protein
LILGRKSELSLGNKLLLYKTILKFIWTYGITLWDTAWIQISKSCNDFII